MVFFLEVFGRDGGICKVSKLCCQKLTEHVHPEQAHLCRGAVGEAYFLKSLIEILIQ